MPAPKPTNNVDEDEEDRILRKRQAARVRQQRCRARKRQAHLEKKLESLTGTAAEEVRQQIAQVQAIAGPSKGYKGGRKDDGSPKGFAAAHPYMMSPQAWGMMPPPAGYYPHMMQPMRGYPQQKNPLTCPPDVMGIPAKHMEADQDKVLKILDGIEIPPDSKEIEV